MLMMLAHNLMEFSTKDNDNDQWSGASCAKTFTAWWYNSCHFSNLNGLYGLHGVHDSRGIYWSSWQAYSLPFVEMKLHCI